MGTMHGGIVATLVDTAMGCAVSSTLPADAGFTTLELKTNYVRAITQATGRSLRRRHASCIAAAASRHRSARHDDSGTLYAHATSTCLIMRGPTMNECNENAMSIGDTHARRPRRSRSTTSSGSAGCSTGCPPTACTAGSSPHPRSRRAAALLRLADVDHDRRDALVALDGDEIVAVARYDGRAGDARPRSPSRSRTPGSTRAWASA